MVKKIRFYRIDKRIKDYIEKQNYGIFFDRFNFGYRFECIIDMFPII